MIDLIHAIFPLPHDPIGRVRKVIEEDGEIIKKDKRFPKKVHLKFDAPAIRVTSLDDGQGIAIHCCPAKVHQGHNVFGSNKLIPLTVEIFKSVLKNLDIRYTKEDVNRWENGGFRIEEVHITQRFAVDSHALVKRVIDHVFHSSTPSLCASRIKLGTGITLYNRGSQAEWMFYDKLCEMKDTRKKFNKKLRAVLDADEDLEKIRRLLDEEARSNIRCELKLNKGYLKRYNLATGKAWLNRSVNALYFQELAHLRLGTIPTIEHVKRLVSRITDQKLQQAFLLWMYGENLSDLYGYQTFNNRRKGIKKQLGIDIKLDRIPHKEPPVEIEQIFSRDNMLPTFPKWAKEYPKIAYRAK